MPARTARPAAPATTRWTAGVATTPPSTASRPAAPPLTWRPASPTAATVMTDLGVVFGTWLVVSLSASGRPSVGFPCLWHREANMAARAAALVAGIMDRIEERPPG